jgi:hypothetical protein
MSPLNAIIAFNTLPKHAWMMGFGENGRFAVIVTSGNKRSMLVIKFSITSGKTL